MAALAREAEEAEGLGWRHKLELRTYSDKAIALQHHHERRLGGVAEQQAQLLADAHGEQQRAEDMWAAREAEAREGMATQAESSAAALSELEAAQRGELASLRRQLEGDLQTLKEDCVDRLVRASHALALRHKVEAHALEERRDEHLHELMVAHRATVRQMRGYYAEIVAEQGARIEGLEVGCEMEWVLGGVCSD